MTIDVAIDKVGGFVAAAGGDQSAGLSDDFLDIPKELHLIATDVETLRRVDFSKGTSPNVATDLTRGS